MSNLSPNLIAPDVATAGTAPLTAEAGRLRGVFEASVERELSAMAVSARAVVRAWAEAEIAIEAARRSQEPGAADLPSAESFRIRPHLPREEVSRERIVRWCSSGRKPLDDETESQVVCHNGAWVVMRPGTSLPAMQLSNRAEFDRVTYLEVQERLDLPPLAEVLAIPAMVAGGNPGWEPTKHLDPHGVLAQLDRLETGYAGHPAERGRTVEDAFRHHVGPPRLVRVEADPA